MPPGPGSLIISQSLTPSSGWMRSTSRFSSISPALASKIECGILRKGMTISDCRQALAGAQVERHARPAPVADLRLQRDEGFRRRCAFLIDSSGSRSHRFAVRSRRHDIGRAPVTLPATCSSIGFSACSTLSFSSRTASASSRPAAPSRPGRAAAACGSAPCRAARRRGRNSRRGPPTPIVSATVICTWSMWAAFHKRLEQGVAEAQRHQVLHRLLAEVVVDAVDLPLGEDRPTASLTARAEARSWPSGFSMTTRERRVTSPCGADPGADRPR